MSEALRPLGSLVAETQHASLDEVPRMSELSRLMRVANEGAVVALLGVSIWGVCGIGLGIAYYIADQPDWSVLGVAWLLMFWFFAALGVVCGYWLRRYEFIAKEECPTSRH